MNTPRNTLPPTRFTVASSESSAVWTFTDGLSDPATAAAWYAEVNAVPAESITIGVRAMETV